MYFLGYTHYGNFSHWLWDPENKQVVQSLDMVFNESEMHKLLERLIEVRKRATFSEMSALLDDLT